MSSSVIKRGITLYWYRYVRKAILLILIRPSISGITKRSFDDATRLTATFGIRAERQQAS